LFCMQQTGVLEKGFSIAQGEIQEDEKDECFETLVGRNPN